MKKSVAILMVVFAWLFVTDRIANMTFDSAKNAYSVTYKTYCAPSYGTDSKDRYYFKVGTSTSYTYIHKTKAIIEPKATCP